MTKEKQIKSTTSQRSYKL